jgi:hypothetical protein
LTYHKVPFEAQLIDGEAGYESPPEDDAEKDGGQTSEGGEDYIEKKKKREAIKKEALKNRKTKQQEMEQAPIDFDLTKLATREAGQCVSKTAQW